MDSTEHETAAAPEQAASAEAEAAAPAADAGEAPEAAPAETGGESPAEAEGDASAEAEAPPAEPSEAELKERLQRLAADYANYQKRVQRDRAKWTQDAVREVLQGLLPVLDNLDQAIAAFAGEVKDPATYKQGVELCQKELLRQLENYSVVRVEAEEGTPFDPDLHQAIMVQEVEGIDAQQVSFVVRPGYRLGESVLRPAQVGVKKPKGA